MRSRRDTFRTEEDLHVINEACPNVEMFLLDVVLDGDEARVSKASHIIQRFSQSSLWTSDFYQTMAQLSQLRHRSLAMISEA